MSGAYWEYREPLSKEVKIQLASMTGNLSDEDIKTLITELETNLGTYIQLKETANRTLDIKKQKESIQNVFDHYIGLQKAIYLLDKTALDEVSLHYQEKDIDTWVEYKKVEQDVSKALKKVEKYAFMLRTGKNEAYKGKNRQPKNQKQFLVDSVATSLVKRNIKITSSRPGRLNNLIKLMLEQNNEYVGSVEEVKGVTKRVKPPQNIA